MIIKCYTGREYLLLGIRRPTEAGWLFDLMHKCQSWAPRSANSYNVELGSIDKTGMEITVRYYTKKCEGKFPVYQTPANSPQWLWASYPREES